MKTETVGQEGKLYRNSILKLLIVLAIPTIIEELLSTLLQYVDTAMVGHLGEDATAAVNVTTTISWLIGSIYSAIGIGFVAMISKAVGLKDEGLVRKISMQALILACITGVTLGIVSAALSPYIPRWMDADETIWQDASDYFLIVSLAVPFRAVGSIFGAAIRATRDTKTPLYISFVINGMNVVLNYIFIYAADMGVVGAALASAVAYFIMGILMFAAYRKNEYLHYSWNEFKPDKERLVACIKVSLPVFGTSITSCLGYIVFARVVSGMGTTIFAAHSIAVSAETIFYIAGYGLRSATSTLVGNSLGEKNYVKYRMVSRMSVLVTMVMMCVSGVLLYFISDFLMSLLTNSARVAELGAEMLRIVAFTEPFFGLMIISEGIFYGLGKTKYPFMIETISMWGIRILFTIFVVKVWGMGLREVWYCMIADNVVKAILLFVPILFNKNKFNDSDI